MSLPDPNFVPGCTSKDTTGETFVHVVVDDIRLMDDDTRLVDDTLGE